MGALTFASLGEHVGRELGASDWVTIDQALIDTFASCTGGRQWIHVAVERARRASPFRGPIPHGCLTLAVGAPPPGAGAGLPCGAPAGRTYVLRKGPLLAPGA